MNIDEMLDFEQSGFPKHFISRVEAGETASSIEAIKALLKKPKSIHGKLIQLDVPLTVASIKENIEDVAGIDMIRSFMNDIYTLVDRLKNQDDLTVVLEKDYIKNPKPNGYRSLHIIVEATQAVQPARPY